MRIIFSSLLLLFSLISFSAKAHPASTLTILCHGSTAPSCASAGALVQSRIENLGSNQYLVLYGQTSQAHCAISKAAAAKQGVTIEFLNEMANRYQVIVTCLYNYPLAPGQVSANEFAFRASMR